ncbi:MAG: RsiV family protein [Lachnospiraceae bacterium]|nr:RsiV family protein [Lachnospiraceae bacterium]MDE7273372.1 RsiV family protein [Lachnospiraceae bacterium]
MYHTEKQSAPLEKELQALRSAYEKQQMTEEQVEQLHQKIREAKNMNQNREKQTRSMIKLAAAAAVAAVGIFVILPNTSGTVAHAMEQIPILGQLVKVVTFRNYEYEGERNMADIEVPEIKPGEQPKDSALQENIDRTTAEINAEIQAITDNLIAEFERNLDEEMGYQDVVVTSEVLTTTPDYFTLKLICYQGAGSGYQWNYYYTIDLNTGERLQLKDIFQEGADYITPISENIKHQMQEQMNADENVYYWLNDEIEEWNFKAITDETSFYLNEKDNVVIGFNEGDVAPMYMGTVEFEIPAEVLEGIRK